MHLISHKVADVGLAAQEPQEFVNNSLCKYLFGGQQRESIGKVEAHLVAKNALCARSCAVTLYNTIITDGSQ